MMNVRSINKNFTALELLLYRLGFQCDVIILTECWIENNKQFPSMTNYNKAFTNNCINQNGGVIVYSKSGIDIIIEEPNFLEANCLLLRIGANVAVIALYRSPSFSKVDTFLDSLDTVLTNIKQFQTISVIGDLNIDIRELNTDGRSANYLELLASHGLIPSHTFPTRDNKCLDHIMLKSKSQCNTVVLDTYITDHRPVILNVVNKSANHFSPKKLTPRIDFIKIGQKIKLLEFSDVMESLDPNVATSLLMYKLMDIVKSSTRLFKVPHSQRIIKPWITPGILRCIRTRDRMHSNLKENPNNKTLIITYSRYRNFCTNLLKKLKVNYHKRELQENKNNIKKTWETIKKITYTTKQKNTSEALLRIKNNPADSVNMVNKYFANVGKTLAAKIRVDHSRNAENIPEHPSQVNSIGLLTTDEEEVLGIIRALKNDCAVGFDGVSTKVIKESAVILTPIITYICNLCMSNGAFPQIFKTSLITPIHKGGNRDCAENYRPISILPAISKILEKLINKRLTAYLEKYNILAPTQFGFRSGRSTEHAVSELTNYIVDKLDNKTKVIGVFLDLAKAFDTVSVPILVRKLELIGIRGNTLNLFKDYLSGRNQKTKVNDVVSEAEDIGFGVPQGSVLGPSLFLVYVNELCNLKLKQGKIFSYADDTALIFVGKTWAEVQTYAEQGLHRVTEWLRENLLSLNVDKTKFIAFSNTRRKLPSLTITAHSNCNAINCTCTKLQSVDTIKYLGVTLDRHMTWKPHIDTLCKRVRKLIFVFKNLREVADRDLTISVYNALCKSILTYCNTSWGGACSSHLIALERAQRAVLKVATFRPYRFPTTELYKDCGVLSVRQLYIHNLILAQHKLTIPHPEKQPSAPRRKYKVFPILKFNTKLAQRHQCFLGPYLYNSTSKIVTLMSLTNRDVKLALNKWLRNLSHSETEDLLKVIN